ncbi:MAG: hypothetical protein WCC60_18375 [Ilumatobacteraceae bacterium]
MDITLNPGESELGSWTLFYLPPNGGKYNGKLVVTTNRLLYDAKFDASFMGMVAEAVSVKWGSEGFVEIPKQAIAQLQVEKKLLSKKCILTLSDGSRHAFDYGALSIDKLVEAVSA